MIINTNEQIKQGLSELKSDVRELASKFLHKYGYYPKITTTPILIENIGKTKKRVVNIIIDCSIEINPDID